MNERSFILNDSVQICFNEVAELKWLMIFKKSIDESSMTCTYVFQYSQNQNMKRSKRKKSNIKKYLSNFQPHDLHINDSRSRSILLFIHYSLLLSHLGCPNILWSNLLIVFLVTHFRIVNLRMSSIGFDVFVRRTRALRRCRFMSFLL